MRHVERAEKTESQPFIMQFLSRLVCRMRDAARKMEEKHFADRHTEHVEFLPVEWRSKLTLDGGMLHLNSGNVILNIQTQFNNKLTLSASNPMMPWLTLSTRVSLLTDPLFSLDLYTSSADH